jgi:acetoin utilization deacetylase AcuC-like enzyme
MRLFYSDDYSSAGHSFDTTRKSRWLADSLRADPIPSVTLERPAPVGRELLELVHSPEYLHALEHGKPRGLAESQGFRWDPGIWRSALAHSAGVVAAAHSALAESMSGSLSCGLHHAHREYGLGYCSLNGLALAAAVLAAEGRSVLVLDLDAHRGGGTHEALRDLPGCWQIDVVPARNGFDSYVPHAGRLYEVEQAEDYLTTVERALRDQEEERPRPDLVLYNAGVDVHEASRIGGLARVDDELIEARERLVFDWFRERATPVAFVLAGGYTGPGMSWERLTRLHCLTVRAAAGIL